MDLFKSMLILPSIYIVYDYGFQLSLALVACGLNVLCNNNKNFDG